MNRVMLINIAFIVAFSIIVAAIVYKIAISGKEFQNLKQELASLKQEIVSLKESIGKEDWKKIDEIISKLDKISKSENVNYKELRGLIEELSSEINKTGTKVIVNKINVRAILDKLDKIKNKVDLIGISLGVY